MTDEESIDLRRYLHTFLSHWWLLLLLPTIGALIAFFYSRSQDAVYEARATILVQYRGGGFSLDVGDFRRSEELAATYRRQVTAKPFLERVAQSGAVPLTGNQLRSMVGANTGTNPPFIDIKVRHSDPTLAAATAQVVAEQLIDYAVEQRLAEIARLQSAAAAQGISNVQDLVAAQFTAVDSLSLLEPVFPPGSPVVPRTRQNTLIGAILGLAAAVGGALLLEGLGDTVRFPDQLSRRFGITGLGTIFKWSPQDLEGGPLVLWTAPTSSYAEAFRQIRANLQFATANRPASILLITSPGPGEGKSTIMSNISIALAQTGKRVMIVDGDLRRPSLHRLFNLSQREPGLSNILADASLAVRDVIQPTGVEGVDIVPAGPTPPNPTELLGSPRMGVVLHELKGDYDVVIVDSPPMLLVADGSVVATQVDGVLVVVDAFGTRSSSLLAALDTLRKTQVNIIGVILNKMKRPRFGYGYGYPYYYYYYYSYYRYYSDKDQASLDGTGPFHRKLGQRVKSAWSRIRRT